MRKLALALSMLTLTAASAALAGYNGSGGGPHIAGEGEGDARTEVNFSADIVRITGNITDERVYNISRTENTTRFSGSIRAPNPCQRLNSSASLNGSKLVVELETVGKSGICTTQLAMVNYRAEASGEIEEIRVFHGKSQAEVINVTALEQRTSEPEEDNGFMRLLMNFFSGLI
ncbi:MAG: hypothetical protein ABEJ03_01035 [Candidatus Nanohaloarchaea archaeon]